MNINEKLATIQTKFKSKKSRFNSFGKYYFRSAEYILEATKPYLLDLGVSVTINEQLIANEEFPIMQSTATITDGKDAIQATALVGVDLQQKAAQYVFHERGFYTGTFDRSPKIAMVEQQGFFRVAK